MKQDKFLTGILVGIGVLILLALGLFLTRQNKAVYMAETTPEGVVHNYMLSVLNKDYQKAYAYLADLDNKPTYQEFRQSFFNGSVNTDNTGVDVGGADINGDEASVSVNMYYSSGDLFSSGYQNQDRVLLVRQNEFWKISSMQLGNYWSYNWYQKPVKP